MKYTLPVLLMIIGASMTFAYPIALDKMVGEEIARHSILNNKTWSYGNQTFTHGKKSSATSKRYQFYLTPQMNPIKVAFPAEYLRDRRATMDKYSRFYAALKLNNQLIWGQDLSIRQRRDSKDKKKREREAKHRHRKSSLGSHTFEVEQAGNYALIFEPKRSQELEVTDIDLVVKRNVAIPNAWIIGSGLVLIVAGFGWIARVRKYNNSAE